MPASLGGLEAGTHGVADGRPQDDQSGWAATATSQSLAWVSASYCELVIVRLRPSSAAVSSNGGR
jgi:hypothetical protein